MATMMPRRSLIGRVIITLVALVLCYYTAVTALANSTALKRPMTALQFAPFHASAQSNAAFDLLQSDQSPVALKRIEAGALSALRREPNNVPAMRTLGLIAAIRGNNHAARARLGLVERLSRRDLATQIWWIEHEVGRGSVEGALNYFDEALRTSVRSSDILMPILVKAASEAPVASALRPFLASRPTYFRTFFIQAADNTPNIDQVTRIGTRLLNPRDRDDQDLINRLLARLGRDGKFDAAWQLFGWANSGAPTGPLVNGDFDHPIPFRLFNWVPTDNDGLTAEIATREGEGASDAMFLVARIGRGLAVQQLLRLPPGRYRLDAVVGDVSDVPIDQPTAAIICAGSNQQVLAPTAFPPASMRAAPFRATFEVASDCGYQWLNFNASASSEDETRAWIDDIRIRPFPVR